VSRLMEMGSSWPSTWASARCCPVDARKERTGGDHGLYLLGLVFDELQRPNPQQGSRQHGAEDDYAHVPERLPCFAPSDLAEMFLVFPLV
jgi:hypothetical protein